LQRFLFGELSLDPEQRVLYRAGDVVALPLKALAILHLLVENAGEVVSRETLRDRVWHDAFVEEANITKNVSQLRTVLRTHLPGTEPIETLPKRGYRFTLPVTLEAIPVPEAHDRLPRSHGREERSGGLGPQRYPEPSGSDLGSDLIAAKEKRGFTSLGNAWRIAAALLLIALTGFGFRRLHEFHHAATQERPSLAVMRLRDISADDANAWFGPALQQTLGDALGAGEGARLISSSRIQLAEGDLHLAQLRAWDKATIQAIGRRLDCTLLLTGDYLITGDQVRLDLQLWDTATGAVLNNYTGTVARQQINPAIAHAADDLRHAIRLPPTQTLPHLIDFTANDGYRNYAAGLQLLDAGQLEDARDLLSNAVLANPDFPLAHSALASAWQALGYADRARSEAKLALQTSSSLPRDKRLLLQANACEIFTDWPKAIDAYTQLAHLYPDDLDYPLALAETLAKSGNPKQALATAQSVIKASKAAANDPRFAAVEATASAGLGDWRGQLLFAGDQIRLAQAKDSLYLEAQGLLAEGNAWGRLGDRDHGLQDFLRAQQISLGLNDTMGQANALAAIGQDQEYREDPAAPATLQQALTLYQKMGNQAAVVSALGSLGCALTYLPDWPAATRAFQAAVALANQLHAPAMAIGPMLDLAYVASNNDDLAREEAEARQVLAVSRTSGNLDGVSSALEYLGDVDFERGYLTNARSEYNQSLAVMKQIDDGYAIAKLMTHMATLETAAGNLATARRLQNDITARHVLMGERLQHQQLAEAALQLEEGHLEQVRASMTDMATKAKTVDPGAEAWRLVAESCLRSGDLPAARAAIERSLALARTSTDTDDYLVPASLTAARIAAAEGHTNRALAELSSLLARTQHTQNKRLQLQIRLAQAQIEPSRNTLLALATDATQHGFGLVAQKAQTTLIQLAQTPPNHPPETHLALARY